MDKKSWHWIPSLYFYQSLPFAIVNLISLLLYQQVGFSNSKAVVLTSLFLLPWSLKLFIAPFLENTVNKKKRIVLLQWLSSFLLLILAMAIDRSNFVVLSCIAFSLLALVSATHDILADSLYLTELNTKIQQYYVGIRTICYQIGILFVKGGLLITLVPIAFYYQINSWRLFFFVLFALVALIALYHNFQLPHAEIKKSRIISIKHLVYEISLFVKKHAASFCFIFFCNCSTAAMQKILPLYLLDPQGMRFTVSQVGALYGILGTSFFMLGVFFSGYYINRFSVAHSVKHSTLFLTFGQSVLLSLSLFKSAQALLYLALFLNQLLTGLANGTYMGYLLTLSNKSEYPMSTYTFCTSLMAFSTLFFGTLSGISLSFLNYTSVFLCLFFVNVVFIGITYCKASLYE